MSAEPLTRTPTAAAPSERGPVLGLLLIVLLGMLALVLMS